MILTSSSLKSRIYHDILIVYKNLTTRCCTTTISCIYCGNNLKLSTVGGKISLIYQQQCYPGWSCCILDIYSILSSLWNHWVVITQNVVSMATTQEPQKILKSVRCFEKDLLLFQISLDFIGQNGGVSLPSHTDRSSFCSGSQIISALKYKFTFLQSVFRKMDLRFSTFSRTLE